MPATRPQANYAFAPLRPPSPLCFIIQNVSTLHSQSTFPHVSNQCTTIVCISVSILFFLPPFPHMKSKFGLAACLLQPFPDHMPTQTVRALPPDLKFLKQLLRLISSIFHRLLVMHPQSTTQAQPPPTLPPLPLPPYISLKSAAHSPCVCSDIRRSITFSAQSSRQHFLT